MTPRFSLCFNRNSLLVHSLSCNFLLLPSQFIFTGLPGLDFAPFLISLNVGLEPHARSPNLRVPVTLSEDNINTRLQYVTVQTSTISTQSVSTGAYRYRRLRSLFRPTPTSHHLPKVAFLQLL